MPDLDPDHLGMNDRADHDNNDDDDERIFHIRPRITREKVDSSIGNWGQDHESFGQMCVLLEGKALKRDDEVVLQRQRELDMHLAIVE